MSITLRGRQSREFEIPAASFRAEQADNGIVTLTWASELPVPRWWGIEILDCNPGSIRMGRLKNGAALLLGHDSREQIGVVEDATVSGGVCRARVRFSSNGPAQAVLRDVRDGIRQKVSVGYQIHDLAPEGEQQAGLTVYRVLDWEPYELSIVSVPADDSVGIGRAFPPAGRESASSREQIMNVQDRNFSQDTDNDPRELLSRRERKQAQRGDLDAGAIEQRAERQRQDDIKMLGSMWPELDGANLARSAILDQSMTADAFRQILRDKQMARHTAPPTVTGRVDPEFEQRTPYGAGAREVLPARLGPFQTERAAYGFGQFLKSQMPDGENARRWMRENFGEQQRAISSTGQGGVLIPTEVSSEIIRNLDSYGVARREARLWTMNSEALNVPVNTSRPTASFTAPGVEVAASDPGFGEVGLYAKQLMSQVIVNRETMMDSVIDLAGFVGQSLSEAFAFTEDSALFAGDATSQYGGIAGLPNALAAGSMIDATAGHDTLLELDNSDFAKVVAAVPEYALMESKWYISSAAWGAGMVRASVSAGGSSISDTEKGPNLTRPQYLGFPVILTPTLPASLTAVYNLGSPLLYFGAMRRAVAFGDRQTISLTVDPFTLAAKSQIRIIGYSRFDLVVHGTGTATAAGPIVGLRGKT
jgi:HK97 family phage major capsid protein